MTNINRIKLTWISFLSYALTGALVIVTGMVMGKYRGILPPAGLRDEQHLHLSERRDPDLYFSQRLANGNHPAEKHSCALALS
jgi:hypothetical protein